MLPSLFIYLVMASAYLTIFYAVYRLVYHRLSFYSWNRVLILALVLTSLVLPLLPADLLWTHHLPKEVTLPHVQYLLNGPRSFSTYHPAEPVHHTTALEWLGLLYAAGVLLMGSRLIAGLVRLRRATRQGQPAREDGFVLVRGAAMNASFFHLIFLREDLQDQASNTVLLHEQYHARHWHSADNLFMECMAVLFWFHPLTYRFHRLLREAHEWETDAYMSRQMDAKEYAHLLLGLAVDKRVNLCNGYNASFLGKRIHVLFNKPNTAMKKSMYLLVAPALVVSLALVSPFAVKAQLQTVYLLPPHAATQGYFVRDDGKTIALVLSLKELIGPGSADSQIAKIKDHFPAFHVGGVGKDFDKEGWSLWWKTWVDSTNQNKLVMEFGMEKGSKTTVAGYRVDEMIDNDYLVICMLDKGTGRPRVISSTYKDAKSILGYELPAGF